MKTYTAKEEGNFEQYLKKGKKGENITLKMLKSQYPESEYYIEKWDYNTEDGHLMEKAGVDYTIFYKTTGFNLHIQTKNNLKSNSWGKYASLELDKNGIPGRFVKGEVAHRWYHINEETGDAIYYDYPRQLNYILNHMIPNHENKFVRLYKDYDGISKLFNLYYEDKLFEGRYTYLKYDKDTETWTVTKNQWKYV